MRLQGRVGPLRTGVVSGPRCRRSAGSRFRIRSMRTSLVTFGVVLFRRQRRGGKGERCEMTSCFLNNLAGLSVGLRHIGRGPHDLWLTGLMATSSNLESLPGPLGSERRAWWQLFVFIPVRARKNPFFNTMKDKSKHTGNKMPARPAHYVSSEEPDNGGPLAPYPPPGTLSEEQRQAAKARILEAVNAWLEARIEEVFEMADEDQEPEIGGWITWRDLNEVRWQICGCIASDLEHDLGDQVEDIMDEEFRRPRRLRNDS